MPPRRFSRYTFAAGVRLDDGNGDRLVLEDRVPFGYEELSDNRTHVVAEGGETLFSIAARYFRGLPRPAGLWWVIADFQPQPILDPTILLAAGTQLVIPSRRTVEQGVFGERRRLTG